jgi:hypothetical protein
MKRLFLLLATAALAGCSIHPVQQDVTGVRTPDIVDAIRCETRLAIQDKALDLLRHYRGGRDRLALALVEEFTPKRGQPWRIDPARQLPDPVMRDFYYRYIQTGIAYDFTFDVTEDNKAAIIADPVRLITNGVAGIGVSASGDFNRNNSRHFIMSDTFYNLVSGNLNCGDRIKTPNYAYPIAGSVGMFELISTFMDLNEDKDLQPLASGNSRVFADTLTFTTTLTGQVAPHVEIAAVGKRWGLASPTNVSAFGQRVDKHMMIVGLSMEPSKGPVREASFVRAVPLPALSAGRSALQKSDVRNSAEQGALDAVRQQRIDTFLDRFGTFSR